MNTTRDLRTLAAGMREIAERFERAADTVAELAGDVNLVVTVFGPYDATGVAVVDQLAAAATGITPVWEQRSSSSHRYSWYSTLLVDDNQPWRLGCKSYALHPDGALLVENERLRARLTELEDGQLPGSGVEFSCGPVADGR